MLPRGLPPLLALCLLALANGEFVPPDPAPSLFHRDELPIDPDTMRSLSAQLVLLTADAKQEDPRQLRAAAQLLAVAGRLDPANTRVRTLQQQLVRQDTPPAPEQGQLQHARSETWKTVAWLQDKEAGGQGQLLGALLLDALHILDPKNPLAAQHDPGGEEARWLGVVAPLRGFSSAPVPETPKPEPTERPAPTPEPPAEQPVLPLPKAPILKFREGSLRAPFFVHDSNGRLSTQIIPLALSVQDDENSDSLSFVLSPSFPSPALGVAQERVRSALLSLWPDLPKEQFAILSTNRQRYGAQNGTAISGPAALLLHSALSGKPLRDDLLLLAEVETDASLKRPGASWDYIAALRKGPGGRLLVSPDLEEQFKALIVLEDPGFFLKYEVLVVSSLDTALNFGSPGSDPPGLLSASATFSEIRAAANGRDVGQLAALDSVRSRLSSIRATAPYHLSAKMLLLQGAGTKRPTHLNRPLLAREIDRALEPMVWIIAADIRTLDADRIFDSWETCRKGLDRVEKFTDPNDLPLFKQARTLADELRTLAREIKKFGGVLFNPSSKVSRLLKQVQSEHDRFSRASAAAKDEPHPRSSSVDGQ